MASDEAATAAAGEPVVRGSAARARCERAPRAPAGRARHGASVVLIRGQARGEPCIPRRNSSRRKCLSGGACCFVLCRCSEAPRRVKSVWCRRVLSSGVSFRLRCISRPSDRRSLRPRQPHLTAAASAPPQQPSPAPPHPQLQRRRGAHERVAAVVRPPPPPAPPPPATRRCRQLTTPPPTLLRRSRSTARRIDPRSPATSTRVIIIRPRHTTWKCVGWLRAPAHVVRPLSGVGERRCWCTARANERTSVLRVRSVRRDV